MTVTPTLHLGAHGTDDDRPQAEVSQLAQFGKLWVRGLADVGRIWSVFDASELYIERREYFGAPLAPYRGVLVSPMFSAVRGLEEFCLQHGKHPGANGPVGEWVRLRGSDFMTLPIRARYLAIDPGTPDEALVDLADRPGTTVLARTATPVLVDLELDPDGQIAAPSQFSALVNELSGSAS